MANSKISALTAATTPLDGTEVLPIVQTSTTKKVANNDLRPKQIQSNATSGVMQIVGPAAAATRVMTIPDANFTVARTDAAQSFTGVQTFNNGLLANYVNGVKIDNAGTTLGQFYYSGGLIINRASGTSLLIQQNSSSEMVLTTDGNVQIGSTSGATARVFVYANNSAGDASGNAAIYVRQDGTNNIQAWAGSGGNIRAYLTSGGTFYLDDDNLVFNTAAKGIVGSSSFSVTIANGAAGNLVDLATALPVGGSGLVIVNGASAGKTTILAQRDSGGYYSVTELGTQPRGTYITSITLSGTNLRITNSTGASETFSGKVVVLTA